MPAVISMDLFSFPLKRCLGCPCKAFYEDRDPLCLAMRKSYNERADGRVRFAFIVVELNLMVGFASLALFFELNVNSSSYRESLS